MANDTTPPLNIPQGNSPVTPDDKRRVEDEKLSGDKVTDFKTAASRISFWDDIKNIGTVPCARSSLLYAIAGGSGIGAVRFLGSRSIGRAANWAVGTFVVVAIGTWENCRAQRHKELEKMRQIQEKFPHRHISNLKRRDGDWVPPPSSTSDNK